MPCSTSAWHARLENANSFMAIRAKARQWQRHWQKKRQDVAIKAKARQRHRVSWQGEAKAKARQGNTVRRPLAMLH